VLHPSEGRDLVEQAVVPGSILWVEGGQLRQRETAEHTEPVINRDEDVAGQRGEALSSVNYPATLGEAAAMHPEQHWSVGPTPGLQFSGV
jgi:hypothetical protein